MTRLPLLPIAFLLATVSMGALVYEKTIRAAPEPEAVVVQVDRVAQAVATTSSAKSFAFTYAATVSAAGGSLTVKGEGSYDGERRLAAMRMHFEGVAPGSPAARADSEIVIDNSDGLVEYIRMPGLDVQLPAGKSWVKIDVDALGKTQGVDLSSLQQSGSADPATMFTLLRQAANLTVVGDETVSGVATTHYRGTIDLRRLATAETDKAARETLERVIALSGVRSYPVEVWVDGAGYLRRMQMTMPLHMPDAPQTDVATMTMTEELSDFGTQVQIAVPPEASVIDIADVAALANAG